MPRALIRRVDENQKQIVKLLRKLGYSVLHLHTLGKGAPDLLVGKWGHNYCFEVKDGKKPPRARRLTEDEEEFWKNWNGSIHLIESEADVLEFDRKRSR